MRPQKYQLHKNLLKTPVKNLAITAKSTTPKRDSQKSKAAVPIPPNLNSPCKRKRSPHVATRSASCVAGDGRRAAVHVGEQKRHRLVERVAQPLVPVAGVLADADLKFSFRPTARTWSSIFWEVPKHLKSSASICTDEQ